MESHSRKTLMVISSYLFNSSKFHSKSRFLGEPLEEDDFNPNLPVSKWNRPKNA